MRIVRALGALALLGVCAPTAWAQLWSGVLPANRATDWTGAGVRGGITHRTTQCGATLSSSSTLAQIQAAVDGTDGRGSCVGKVVLLGAGTFGPYSGRILVPSDVTLRGSGPMNTVLRFTGRGGCGGPTGFICTSSVGGGWIQGGFAQNNFTSINWTAGFSQDTTTITLASAPTGLQVGDLIRIERPNDTAYFEGTYACSNAGVCTYGTVGGEQRPGYRLAAIKIVTAINGTQVTLASRIHAPDWNKTGMQPMVSYGDFVRPGYGVGIEDLTISDEAAASGASAIVFFVTRDSWMRNVRIHMTSRNAVDVYQSAHITIRDSYFYGCLTCVSENYGIENFGNASDILAENNIFQRVTTPLNWNDGGVGNVQGYNFAIDNERRIDQSPFNETGQMMHSWYQHGGVTWLNLFEGNSGTGFMSDDWWGTSSFATLFRQHLYGDICAQYLPGSTCPAKTGDTETVSIAAYQANFNVIGNVLGRSGYYDTYQNASVSSCPATAIYCVGHSHATGGPTDTYARTSLYRWGNYDTVTGAVRWCGTGSEMNCGGVSEVPTGLSYYAVSVPASQTLPASFYHATRPSAWWRTPWGTPPWPPVGPDVTGGNISGYNGMAHKIPARLCWENQTQDSTNFPGSEIRTFDASTCYLQATSAAPGNFRFRNR